MADFFSRYSVSEIVIFIIALAFAVKEFITFVDWGKDRLKTTYDKSNKSKENHRELRNEINELNNKLNQLFDENKRVNEKLTDINRSFENVNKRVEMLIDSDKEDIKAYITEKHHFFVYERGWVDDHSLDCLEHRFAVYKQEHGNSFAEGLMNEIRALPKCPPNESKNN